MTANRLLLAILPAAIMIVAMVLTSGMEHRLATLGTNAQAKLILGRAGLALPYIGAAAIGVIALFATNGSANIKATGMSVLAGSAAVIIVAIARENHYKIHPTCSYAMAWFRRHPEQSDLVV